MNFASARIPALALLAGIFGGFILGRIASPAHTTSNPSGSDQRLAAAIERIEQEIGTMRRHQAPSKDAAIASAIDSPELRKEIQKMLREELRDFLSRVDPGSVQAGDNKPSPEVETESPEQLASYDEGKALIDQAISSRSWNRAQATKLHAILPRLSEGQRITLLKSLFDAMTRGEIVSDGPPL